MRGEGGVLWTVVAASLLLASDPAAPGQTGSPAESVLAVVEAERPGAEPSGP